MKSLFPIELNKKNKSFIVFGILIFWLIIGIIIFITEFIAYKYFGEKPLDEIEKRQYLIRWILWLLLTPIIIGFAFRLNFERSKIFQLTIFHLLFGTFILVCEFFIEYGIIHFIGINYYNTNITLRAFIVPYLHKYWAYIAIYFLIIGIVNVFLYILKYRLSQNILLETELRNKELTHQLTLSQLEALKMQIHPHFLFNVHQSIIGLIIKKENDQAKEMLLKLSNLLRSTLEKQNADLVTLEEEMHIIKLYLEIQSIRFKDRFDYEIKIDDKALTSFLPYLLLQPIVENAMIHGIEKLEDNGFLLIEASTDQDNLKITVTDNGTSNLKNLNYRIGLSNIENRLQQYYNQKAIFTLQKNQSNQTVATLIIPQINQDEFKTH